MTPGHHIGAEPCTGVVLVVDDDDDIREAICELLEDHGHHAVGAHDGVEAMALLRGGEKVCFMVLDLLMPRMNGLQVLQEVSGDPQLRELKFCMSTSSVDRAPIGVRLLPKPIDARRLLTMVDASCVN